MIQMGASGALLSAFIRVHRRFKETWIPAFAGMTSGVPCTPYPVSSGLRPPFPFVPRVVEILTGFP
jgi:hypothetical protein